MKLIDLDPRWLCYLKDRIRSHPETLAEAQGVFFLCPKCFEANKGPIGTHYVEVTFADRGVADVDGSHNKEGKPTRWRVHGTDFRNLSTIPSIQLEGGCGWHGFLTNGVLSG